MRFLSIVATLAVGLRGAMAGAAEDYLASNSDITMGRDALESAEAKAGGDSYATYTKPAEGIVLVQGYNADTNERLYAVALVNDEKAEDYYERYKEDDAPEDSTVHKRCAECGGGGPHCDRAVDVSPVPSVFRRDSRCWQFCGRSDDCRRPRSDRACPLCVYVGGNCRWQLRCRPR